MMDKLVEVHIAAKRLKLHPSSIRRMFKKGLLRGFLTGASGTRIRIFESSIEKHMKYEQEEQ